MMEYGTGFEVEKIAKLVDRVVENVKSVDGRRYLRALQMILGKKHGNWKGLSTNIKDHPVHFNNESDKSAADQLLLQITKRLYSGASDKLSPDYREWVLLWNNLCNLVNHQFSDSLIYVTPKTLARVMTKNQRLFINGKLVKLVDAHNKKIFADSHTIEIPSIRECLQRAGFTLVPEGAWDFIQEARLNQVKNLKIFSTAYESLSEEGVIACDGNEFGGLCSGGAGYRCFRRPAGVDRYWRADVIYWELEDFQKYYFAVY